MTESKQVNTVNICPTWKAAAQIYITALECGTEEGKRAAREGILEMAQHLDNFNANAREAAGPDVHAIFDDITSKADELMTRNKREARGKGWIIVSRGYEMLSLNADGERDENIVDYVEDDKLTPEVIQEYIDDVRKAGSAYLAIGYGVDQADDQEGYDCGDYSPMHDWVDFDNIAV